MAKETKVTTARSVSHYFYVLLYECTLNQETKITLSTIRKYKHIAEQLVILLKMWGWVMDDIEKNPYETIEKGRDRPLTLIKYVLVLNPVMEAIQEEIIKDKKSRDILMYLLNNLHENRRHYADLNDEVKSLAFLRDPEFRKVLTSLIEIIKNTNDASNL